MIDLIATVERRKHAAVNATVVATISIETRRTDGCIMLSSQNVLSMYPTLELAWYGVLNMWKSVVQPGRGAVF